MPKAFLTTFFSWVVAFSVFAQQPASPLKTEFLDGDFIVLPSEAGAVYRRETEMGRGKAAVVHDYFLSGKLAQSTSYENLDKHQANGTSESWYESGQLKLHCEYTHGQRSGELRTYYPGGQLKRREHYANGKFVDGECFEADGTAKAFTRYEIMPVYSEGNGSMADAVSTLQRNFRYPADALRARTQGRVLVGFTITKTGEVANVHIVQSLSAVIDAEALRAAQQIRPFTPARLDDEPVNIRCTAPITLIIN